VHAGRIGRQLMSGWDYCLVSSYISNGRLVVVDARRNDVDA
jgi:hypothetical protein